VQAVYSVKRTHIARTQGVHEVYVGAISYHQQFNAIGL